MRDSIRRLTLIASQLTIVLIAACDVTGPPKTGNLEISVVSSGSDLDLDGYGVTIDDAPRGTVSANGVMKITDLTAGIHTIALTGVAQNCTPSAANPNDALVRGAATTKVSLVLRCVASGVLVTVTTVGIDADSNGYAVAVDGAAAADVPSNGTVRITRLTAGTHTLVFNGIAGNCSLSGDSPESFSVTLGVITPIAVRILCYAANGVIEIRAATSGADLDPDGYAVRLDGVSSQPLAINGVTRVNRVQGGVHSIALEGIATNCVVAGDNPRTLTVLVGGATRDTARSNFVITCASTAGSIHVTTTTSGSDLDTDGYGLYVDQTCEYDYYYGYYCTYTSYGSIGVNDGRTISDLARGGHSVLLDGIARNCRITGDNPRTITVETALTTEVPIAITCFQTGSVDVTVATTGSDLDPDGYVVYFHGPMDTSIVSTANGTRSVAKLLPGDYSVTLNGVAINCTPAGSNPRPITVTSGAATPLTYDVSCATARQLAFVETSGSDEIYRVKENGTESTRLTNNSVPDGDPAWSPDGLKLAFRSTQSGNADIYTMNADGSNVTRLTTATAADYGPSWSPDGSRIAFTSERDGHAEIYVMNADGSTQTRLTTGTSDNREPAWAPSGTQIAFASWQFATPEIFVMQSDGTSPQRRTTSGNNEAPAWSPDGLKLAFQHAFDCYYGCSYQISTMNADGSGVVAIATGTDPDWSRDGAWIAYVYMECNYYYGCYNSGIWSIHPGGGPLTQITGAVSWAPAWRP